MATNPYFSRGSRSEQLLYEDLIIESLKMYGQDVYYMPRELVNVDQVFDDDVPSRFDNAYKIEMYIENTEGFDGEGDLFTKFGVEIRDAATFIVSRRRWNTSIAPYEVEDDKPFYRPREGDLIFLTLSGSIFEITKVEDESPFYQLKNLPVFKMRCELFEYSDEDFDTGVEAIDIVESAYTYQTVLTLSSISGTFEVGEDVHQDGGTYTMKGEVVKLDYSDPSNKKLYIAHFGATDGEFHSFVSGTEIIGQNSGATAVPTTKDEVQNIQQTAQNDDFQSEAASFIDFSESNPFGDPF